MPLGCKTFGWAGVVGAQSAGSRLYVKVAFPNTSRAGEEMFLPVRATETVRDGKRLLRNEITFQDCRKLSADSKVTFVPEQR